MPKQLAIVLVNWNSFELTKDTLESLHQTTFTNYDCIVVDNGSIDGSGDRIETAFPNCIVLKSSTNKGFTGGNNIGMDYALQNGYEYIMLLNNDVAVEPNFLEPLISRLDQDPKIGAVQPLIYFHHDRNVSKEKTINSWIDFLLCGRKNVPPKRESSTTRSIRLRKKRIRLIAS